MGLCHESIWEDPYTECMFSSISFHCFPLAHASRHTPLARPSRHGKDRLGLLGGADLFCNTHRVGSSREVPSWSATAWGLTPFLVVLPQP